MRRAWMLLGVVAVLGAACAQGGGGGFGADLGRAGEGQASGAEPGHDQPAGSAPDVAGLPPLSPTVIRTANLEVEVGRDGFRDALQEATGLAGLYGGFVVSTSVQGEDARSGILVIRVPAQRFEAAVTDLRKLGVVKEERVSSEEVGQEFVDLEARLRNLTAQERVLIRLMDASTTIAETIKVQKVLQGVQLEVEQIEGRLRYLEDQVALATISVRLVEEGAPVPEPAGIFGRAWQAAVEGFLTIVAALLVGLGYLAPFALLGGAGVLVYSRARRKPVPSA